MVVPAKITAGAKGRDGDVLRRTLPYGLAISLLLCILAWLWILLVR